MKQPALVLAAVVLLAAAQTPPTPPPPPNVTQPQPTPASGTVAVPVNATASPTPSADEQLRGLLGPTGASPAPNKPTPSPPPDARKGLEGVWEVQIQRGAQTDYAHFNLKQSDNALTGTYLTPDKKKYPVAGAIDGTHIRLVVSLADGSTILMEGNVQGTTDMLGMLTNAKERVPFTAAYRPKEKWIDNVNAAPGGLGGAGGGGYGGGPPR